MLVAIGVFRTSPKKNRQREVRVSRRGMDQGWRGEWQGCGQSRPFDCSMRRHQKNDDRRILIRRVRGCPRGTGRCRGWCPGSSAPRTVPPWTWGLGGGTQHPPPSLVHDLAPTASPPSLYPVHGHVAVPLTVGAPTPAQRGDSRRLGLSHNGSRIFIQSAMSHANSPAPVPHHKGDWTGVGFEYSGDLT